MGNVQGCGKSVFKILYTLKTPKNMGLRENKTQKRAAGAKKKVFEQIRINDIFFGKSRIFQRKKKEILEL